MDDGATRMDERSKLVEEEQEEGGWGGPFFMLTFSSVSLEFLVFQCSSGQ